MNSKSLILFGILFSLALVFSVLTSALVIDSVTTTPAEIAPGETAAVKIGLENNGDKDIEDVSVSLVFREVIRDSFGSVVSVNEVPFAPGDSSSEYSIDEIKEGKIKYADFKIVALNDVESGVYKMPVKIEYYDKDVKYEKDSLISLIVNSEPIISANIENNLLLKGKENEVSIKVINKDLSDAKFLEVTIKKGTYYTILSQESIYIGDVDSDDFDTVNFKIYFRGDSPSSVRLPVSIVYKDSLNKEYKKDINLQTRVYAEEEAIKFGLLKKSNITTYIIIVVALIILWIVYRKIKKRRKMKRKAE